MRTFELFDPGDIDVLNIDCEGMEWAVCSCLRSCPQLIGIELWPAYPHRQACLDWLVAAGYVSRAKLWSHSLPS